MRRIIFNLILIFSSYGSVFSQWIDISNVDLNMVETKMGGAEIIVEYDLKGDDISEKMPAYIFIRYSLDGGATWDLLPSDFIKGNGFDMVSYPGHKEVFWWGAKALGYVQTDSIKVKIMGIQMVRIPGGDFKMKSFPGGGKDPTVNDKPNTVLPTYHIAKYETAISMYTDYLNEVGGMGRGWYKRMSDSLKCGIVRKGSSPGYSYEIKKGKEDHPVAYVSLYDALSFLGWCGLTLPTEAMWEKAFIGGIYLDGDDSKQVKNPLPERNYPWGNELPDEDSIYRCNVDGDMDGYVKTAPVGSFSDFNSPYGVCDMAGNLAEWTIDWYTTSFHVGLDGFRMIRGGSWRDIPFACDAVTGASQFPIKKSNIMGFRGAKR